MDMNRTVILAGGAGTRMGGCVPKQFINVNGKPLSSTVWRPSETASVRERCGSSQESRGEGPWRG